MDRHGVGQLVKRLGQFLGLPAPPRPDDHQAAHDRGGGQADELLRVTQSAVGREKGDGECARQSRQRCGGPEQARDEAGGEQVDPDDDGVQPQSERGEGVDRSAAPLTFFAHTHDHAEDKSRRGGAAQSAFLSRSS
ncbi:MAG: hypothetical protein M3417_16050 [Actinomycetota bacterium]|nr:hypothetical protein [Actinomycetota bacterium]